MKTAKKFLLIALLTFNLVSCKKDNETIDDKNGLSDLYIYDVDKKINSRITDSPQTREFAYSFSPDSKKIFFIQGDETKSMRIDGTHITSFAPLLNSPAWSPSGDNIAYINEGNIFLLNYDGTNKRQLTHTNIHPWKPIWSKDGQKIACSSDSGLCVITLDGKIVNFSKENSSTWYDWSADSKKLVYSKHDSYNYPQIFIYDLSNGKELQLTDNKKYNYNALWRPFKDEIIFTSSNSDYGSDIVLMNADGSEKKNISHKNSINSLCWSPDGKFIAFITDESNLAIIDINGNNYQIINDIPGACLDPIWSPDGKYILYNRALVLIDNM